MINDMDSEHKVECSQPLLVVLGNEQYKTMQEKNASFLLGSVTNHWPPFFSLICVPLPLFVVHYSHVPSIRVILSFFVQPIDQALYFVGNDPFLIRCGLGEETDKASFHFLLKIIGSAR